MHQHADLFPGFESHSIYTSAGRIFARAGGNGPPLLLLHGYPQTHVMWHRMAATLAEQFTLVIPDLPGYGSSDVPETDAGHTPFTKRAMGKVMVEVMEKLGHSRFALVGHDRGGRVGYRLALDEPQRLSRLVVLDILPTYDYWAKLDRQSALRIFHWTFLAQPYPLPESLISKNSDDFFGRAFSKGFDARAVNQYLSALRDPARVHAICEDYRAGAYADFEQDKADRENGRRITCPLFVAWGRHGIASAAATPLETWKTWATDVSGSQVEAGHFLCEENPEATLIALWPFLTAKLNDFHVHASIK
jgi:haloacetate dehalogenase